MKPKKKKASLPPSGPVFQALQVAAAPADFELKQRGSPRKFRVTRVRSTTGALGDSFKIWEMVDGQLTPRGSSLSCPTFDDACRIADQRRVQSTGTYSHLIKEKRMAVKKKAAVEVTKQTKKTLTKLAKDKKLSKKGQESVLNAKEAKEFMAKGAASKKEQEPKDKSDPSPSGAQMFPTITIVVQAKDGKWIYGRQEDEKKLLATAKGKYETSADASEACAKDPNVQIIMNTDKNPRPSVPKKTTWGVSMPSGETETKKSSAGSGIVNGVSLKKVCADADIDPKLARRILRSKGKKPGGRWEWTKEDAPKIVEMLKEAAKAEKAKEKKK